MIYKKEANFPYPVLSSTLSNYEEAEFNIRIKFEEENDFYRFKILADLTSNFMQELLKEEKVQFVLVVQTKDTKFFQLKPNQMEVEIAKNRMSLSSRTSIQLQIVAKTKISFSANNELSTFYQEMKNFIQVNKHSMLAYSNVVTFEGGMKKPLEIFEKKLDVNLKSEIKFELASESIILYFRDEEFMFSSLRKANALLNPYIYTGLRAALERFLVNYSEDDGESVDVSDLAPPTDLLDLKLYNLMLNKSVDEFTKDNLDEVVNRLTNNIIGNYVKAIKELSPSED